MNEAGLPTTSDTGPMAQHLADIARVLLAPGTMDETLQRVLTLTVASIEGCDEAGLCGPGPEFASSALITELDRLQTALDEGPCVEALAGSDSIFVPDLSEDRRWPRFSPLAVEAGLRSALAYRLSTGGETLGALQLFARLPGAFNATERAEGLLIAAHAGMALAVAQSSAAERFKTDNLQAALVSRTIIGQAQGILMERERITADQAFDLLRRSSQRLNLKLRVVAQELVDTGSVPGRETPDAPSRPWGR